MTRWLPERFAARATRALANPSAIVIANAVAQSFIRFASNVLLARLLAPAAFGLTAITMLILTGLTMLSDVGIEFSALRKGALSEDDKAQTWTLQLARGAVLALLVALLAGPVAALYGEPRLANVLRVAGLMLAIQGAQSLYPILRLRELDLRPQLKIELVGRIIAAIVSVLVALVRPDVWALVAGMFAQSIYCTVASHVIDDSPRPRLRLTRAFLADHWRFSRWIQMGSTLTFGAMQMDKALFPLFYGMARFGLYGVGASVALIPQQITLKWVYSYHFPLASRLLQGPHRDVLALGRVRNTMLLFIAVATAFVIGVSPPFFYLLYKPAYHLAGRFSQLLAGVVYFELAEIMLRHFILVAGSSRYETIAWMVRIAAFLAMAAAIWRLGSGPEYYALAFTAAAMVSYGFMLVVCVKRGDLSPRFQSLLFLAVALVVGVAFLAQPQLNLTMAWVQGGLVTLAAAVATVLIWLHRGLPTAPASAALLAEPGVSVAAAS